MVGFGPVCIQKTILRGSHLGVSHPVDDVCDDDGLDQHPANGDHADSKLRNHKTSALGLRKPHPLGSDNG